MEASGLWLAIMQRADSVLLPAVEDLTVEELRAQPAGLGSNPIGWLVWHLAMIQDRLVATIAGSPTVWEQDGWRKRFKQGEDALHIPPDQVQTFDPADTQTLLGYYQAVRNRGAEVVGGLSAADLASERQQPGTHVTLEREGTLVSEQGWQLEAPDDRGNIASRGCNQFELRHLLYRALGAPDAA
jgi:hypothetical protein